MSSNVYIVSAVRTPMGSFLGSLSTVPAPKLGSVVIKGALEKAGLDPKEIEEVYMGNVLQAGMGQAPARQAALGAGLSNSVPSTTVNKVCASGMKAIALARATIAMGEAEIVIAGGMENMSQVPHYLDARKGTKFGDIKMRDGMLVDGLTDVYNKTHMGNCAELCAREKTITREEQDEFAITSYKRSAAAWESGAFNAEVVPVEIPQRKGDPIIFSKDEEYLNVKMDRIPTLRPAFDKEGSITAANASTLNDGASAVILASEEAVERHNLKPIARILGVADAAHEPEWFTTAPSLAIPIALDRAGLSIDDIDLWELNEAFSVVGIVNNRELGLDPEKVNVNGGAVALGHPLGSSGCRIVVTLVHALKARGLKYGAAGICNGGGGASAIVIEAL
ncbi:MAG TPA: acetyl-CoA C-acyltransferase [Flavobacteriales bacterium]|jgi:acetyl-CoA C-acetyltransferase|nr:acetyl-CoA C-acyltransferase [Flavobacteriales bacterium]HIN41789.1 acetyl-CoA C-acyltransferase [Flavobacteriales bacterium]HIO59759.1 acetyl-CoA C-acyltransferase [Flavobacteriales bacterium]